MRLTTRLILALLVCASLPLTAQDVVLPESLPTYDRGTLAAWLHEYAAGPDARLGREITVRYFVSADGLLHSPFITKTEVQVIGRTSLFHALEGYRMTPAMHDGKSVDALTESTFRFERLEEAGELVQRIIIDGEAFDFPPLQPFEDFRAGDAGVIPVLGTTTPPSLSGPALSMELNMVSLSFTETFEGTIAASLLVEADGRHGPPVLVTSDVDPRFTSDVIDVLSGFETTAGTVKGRPVRSLLEVLVICTGVKTSSGRTEQGVRIGQDAPIPVPEADAITMDTVAIPDRQREMVEQETVIYEQIEAPTDPASEGTTTESFILVPPTPTESNKSVPQEEVITTEVGASYNPDELSRLIVFPEEIAEREREEYVVLNVHITREGKAGVVEVLAGSWKQLEEPAINAVRKLTFEPAKVNDRPVESTLVITVRYEP